MRDASDLFGQTYAGTRTQRLIVDVFYDDDRTFADLPVSSWSFSWDLESELKSSGDLTVAYTSQAGESLSPTGFLDTIAPYGQEINVLIEVTVGDQSEVLQLGRFRINTAPEATDSYFTFLGKTLTAGSLVKLTVDDLFSTVKRAAFHWPEPPILTTSTWDEIQRLTGLPVAPNLDDQPTPAGVIYEPKDGGRLAAVQLLTSYLGGIGVTNSFGEVTAIPFDAGPPVITLSVGDGGQVISVSSTVNSDGLYNLVSGTYQRTDGTPIYATAQAGGTLAPDGPFGEYTYLDTSDTITTQAQANARVQQVLARLLEANSTRITLSCVADYRLEQGDMVTFVSHTGQVTGRVLSISFTDDGLMEVTIDVRS